MNCPKCGAPIRNGAKFCEECGEDVAFLQQPNQFNQMSAQQGAYRPPNTYQPPVNNQYGGYPQVDDKKSIGLNIVSWFIPLVGIILYFSCRKEKPIRSKSNLKVAIISIVVNAILFIVLAIGLAGLMVKTAYSIPGSTFNINGKEYVVGEDGSTQPADSYSDSEDGWQFSFDNSSDEGIGGYSIIGDKKYYGDKELEFPMPYSEFSAIVEKEYQYDESVLKSTVIAPGEEEDVKMIDSDGEETTLVLTFKNNSSSKMSLYDCDVIDMDLDFDFDF